MLHRDVSVVGQSRFTLMQTSMYQLSLQYIMGKYIKALSYSKQINLTQMIFNIHNDHEYTKTKYVEFSFSIEFPKHLFA